MDVRNGIDCDWGYDGTIVPIPQFFPKPDNPGHVQIMACELVTGMWVFKTPRDKQVVHVIHWVTHPVQTGLIATLFAQ